jgi:hypothetical protein
MTCKKVNPTQPCQFSATSAIGMPHHYIWLRTKTFIDFLNRRPKKLILKIEDQKFKNFKIGGQKMYLSLKLRCVE